MRWLNAGNEAVQTVHIMDHLIRGILQNDLAYFLERTVLILLYVGLFTLPFVLYTLPAISWSGLKRNSLKVSLGLAIILILYLGSSSFPFGNVFYNLGLGPKILKDTYWGSNIHPELANESWQALIFPSGLITAILLLGLPLRRGVWKQLFANGPLQAERLIRFGIFLVLLIYTGFLIIGPYLFDRYTLPLIAFALLFFLPFTKRFPQKAAKWMASVSLLIYLLFSLLGTQHYLSWNRTRWQALEELMTKQGIDASRIDGGFEFNTWLKTGPYNKEDRYGKSWWRVAEDEYVLGLGRIPDFEVKQILPVKAVWPFDQDSIFVLWHKVEGLALYEDYPIRCDAEKIAPDPHYFSSNLPQIRFHHDLSQSNEKAHRGQYSMALTEGKEYGFSTTLKDIRPGDELRIRVWRWDETKSAGLAISNQGGKSFYIFEKANVIQEEDGWQQLEILVKIPTDPGFDQVGIYVWNPVKVDTWFDDLEIDRKPGTANKEVENE